jgi:molybdopterin molybdotransferase
VPLEQALGATLAEPVRADRDYPPFPRVMMDGYAVRLVDAGKNVRVIGELAAGSTWDAVLQPGTTIEIMTGAPCPPGAEAVVEKELVQGDPNAVILPGTIRPGQNIIPVGGECAAGSVVIDAGAPVTPLALAAMATFGIETVCVYPRPCLAIITTGAELVPVTSEPGPAQIRNSNGPMLAAMARQSGIANVCLAHVPDAMDELGRAITAASDDEIIVLTGAVSEGKYDNVPKALEAYGATLVFHKVSQRPGKPLLFATKDRQLIFGLPGNPLSCHLGFHRYVAPAVRKMMGLEPLIPPAFGVLTKAITIKGPRTVFQLAHVMDAGDDWVVRPLKGKGSADLYSAATANAMLRFEPESGLHAAGSRIDFEWIVPAN